MNTTQHEQDLQELQNEFLTMKKELDLLKSKLKEEKILTEELLITPVFKEKEFLEKHFVIQTIIGPLILFPMLIITPLIFSSLAIWWRVVMSLLLAIILYGMSLRVYIKNKKQYNSNNVFGMMGNTVEELENYCHKTLKKPWQTFVVLFVCTLLQLVIFHEDITSLEFTWSSVTTLLIRSQLPVLLPIVYLDIYRRRKRLRSILQRIQEIRSGLREEGKEG